MSCYSPIKAYPGLDVNRETGKRALSFSGTRNLIEGTLYTVPCGGCIGCRIDRSRSWAIRSHHEAVTCKDYAAGRPMSCFLTLTFAPDHLPADNSVRLETMQKFLKDLRYRVGSKVRYLLCGEYGDRRGRAHYHVLVFGEDFVLDRKLYKRTQKGLPLYKSPTLDKAWPFGDALIGDVSFGSAQYVASYVTKTVGGEMADAHYWRVSPVDGETYRVEPEFSSMSLKPGLGEAFLRKFMSDVYPGDSVWIEGKQHKPPRYYDQLYELIEGEAALKRVKRERKAAAVALGAQTKERLAAKALFKMHTTNWRARSVEGEQ